MTKTILVIDDEKRLCDLVRAYLTQEGFRVVTAGDGQQGLFVARHEKPDLIILDLMMPVMNGPFTLQNLRQLAGLETTPVIFLTAKVQPNEIKDFIALGAIDVIPKPFDPMTLADKIRDVLNSNG